MKILYFTDTFFPQINGVTNTLTHLQTYLNQNQLDYLVFAPEYENEARRLHENHVRRFKSISLPAYPECRVSLPLYSNMCRHADQFSPDLVHLMTPAGIGLSGLKYAQERNLPVVASFTTSFDTYLKYYNLDLFSNLLWTYFKWFHNACRMNFCPSQDTAEILRAKGIERVEIWSRGIDTQGFHPENRNSELALSLAQGRPLTFLYVGRLAPEKDLDILLASIEKINCLWPTPPQFIITGDGPAAQQLKKTAPDNVSFTGFLRGRELAALYASCDAFVFPSTTETFGNVVLEAMASGLPVVAPAAGGVKDSIIDGYNGFLCKPRDVESFTQGIARFLEDPGLIGKMGENARAYTQTKSWTRIFDQLIADYHQAVTDHNQSSPLTTKIS